MLDRCYADSISVLQSSRNRIPKGQIDAVASADVEKVERSELPGSRRHFDCRAAALIFDIGYLVADPLGVVVALAMAIALNFVA